MPVVRMHERHPRPTERSLASTHISLSSWLAPLVLALSAVLVVTPSATAQSLFGSLSGTVTDSQGGVLPGATVTLTDQASRTPQTTTSNDQGVFVFAAVPAATYAVKVELTGFSSWEATDI